MSIEHFWPRANPADGVDIHGNTVVMAGPHGFGHYSGNRDPWTGSPSSPAALQRKYGKTRSPVSPHSCATCMRNNPSPAACVRCLKKHNRPGELCAKCERETKKTPQSHKLIDYAEIDREEARLAKRLRKNPSAQALDRSVQSDLNALQGHIPEGHYDDARTILTWLHRNEMDSIATYFVDSMKKGRDKFVRDFHMDKNVLGGLFKAKAGKASVVSALKSLKAASWASVRENPSTGTKMVIAGVTIAGIAGIALYSRRASATTTSTTTPVVAVDIGPQPPSNAPTVPMPETEVVITAPPPGSPPDALPVEHVEPVSGHAPAPEPPAAPPTPPTAPSPTRPPVAGTTPHTGLVGRLSMSDAARQIFVLQALAYEWQLVGDVPDGLMGPRTAGTIREIDRQYGVGTPSGVFRGVTTISRLEDVMRRANDGNLPTPRLLPFTLPRSVVRQVNTTGTRLHSPILLQIQPA